MVSVYATRAAFREPGSVARRAAPAAWVSLCSKNGLNASAHPCRSHRSGHCAGRLHRNRRADLPIAPSVPTPCAPNRTGIDFAARGKRGEDRHGPHQDELVRLRCRFRVYAFVHLRCRRRQSRANAVRVDIRMHRLSRDRPGGFPDPGIRACRPFRITSPARRCPLQRRIVGRRGAFTGALFLVSVIAAS